MINAMKPAAAGDSNGRVVRLIEPKLMLIRMKGVGRLWAWSGLPSRANLEIELPFNK